MPVYHQQGELPHKRHTQFRNPGGGLYYEELFGTIGFDGMSSLLYHGARPTQVKAILERVDVAPELASASDVTMRRLKTGQVKPATDFLESRVPLLVNKDLIIGVAAPDRTKQDYFYKNADADELLFIHQGKGRLKTMLGCIDFVKGDYLIIPRGMIYQIDFESDANRLLYLESHCSIYTPNRYRNNFGQLREQAPYCERDYKLPVLQTPSMEKGEFLLKIKKQNAIHQLLYASHPFDVVGWDGYNFPWGISIYDFEPITGRIHQPPPVHQMFQTSAFVVCSFCPRLYDYHPKAIPAPYHHSNIDSDEVIYYVEGDFMSRNEIAEGDITLHPAGIPHGPHPGAMERSIGKTMTNELAVMVDTFHPLMPTTQAIALDDGVYFKSWAEA